MKLANSESARKVDQDYIIRFVKKDDFEKVSFVSPTGVRAQVAAWKSQLFKIKCHNDET